MFDDDRKRSPEIKICDFNVSWSDHKSRMNVINMSINGNSVKKTAFRRKLLTIGLKGLNCYENAKSKQKNIPDFFLHKFVWRWKEGHFKL